MAKPKDDGTIFGLSWMLVRNAQARALSWQGNGPAINSVTVLIRANVALCSRCNISLVPFE
jgi:hypothetical protein